jgi:hypothetical protein
MKSTHQAVFLSVFSFVKRTLPTYQRDSIQVSTCQHTKQQLPSAMKQVIA